MVKKGTRKKTGASEAYVRLRLPERNRGEIFAIAEQLLGASRIKVMCSDGKSRLGRIPGKIKKRMWIREGDLLIVRPWNFQDDKADIIYRYTKTQASSLKRKKLLPNMYMDLF
ncbi:MAG: translation initiation factor eIF-1A [Methanomassiliicoccales archaeon]|nr:MAG: translation initiation factor eIF-1A [Methanomassiliicoccales archaeon]